MSKKVSNKGSKRKEETKEVNKRFIQHGNQQMYQGALPHQILYGAHS